MSNPPPESALPTLASQPDKPPRPISPDVLGSPDVPGVPDVLGLPALPLLRRDVAIIARPHSPLLLAGSGQHVLTVHDPPPGLPDWLADLDGTRTLPATLLSAPLSDGPARLLLTELVRAGLLTDGNRGRPFADPIAQQRDALRQADVARDGSRPPLGRPPTRVGLHGRADWIAPLRAGLAACPEQVTAVIGGRAPLHVFVATADRPLVDAGPEIAGARLDIEISAFDVMLSPLSGSGRPCRRCWARHADTRPEDWRNWLRRRRAPSGAVLPEHHRAMAIAVAVEHVIGAAAVLTGQAAPELAGMERRLDLRSGTLTRARPAVHRHCLCDAIAA